MLRPIQLFRPHYSLLRRQFLVSQFQKRLILHVEDSGDKDKAKKVLSEFPGEKSLDSEKKVKEDAIEKQKIPEAGSHLEEPHYAEAQQQRKMTPPTGPQDNPTRLIKRKLFCPVAYYRIALLIKNRRMKDGQGQMRGACTESGCGCKDYTKPSDSNKCDFCGHYPTQHKAVGASVSVPQSSPSTAKQPEPSRAQVAQTSSPSTANRSNSFSSSSTNTSNVNSNPPAKTAAKSNSSSSMSPTTAKKAEQDSDDDDDVQFAPRDPSVPATAVSSKPTKKKTSILDDLKNPKKLIKEKTKKHKD